MSNPVPRFALPGLLMVGPAIPVSAANPDVQPEAKAAPVLRDGSRDFDFLHGRWTVHNRRLLKRLAGSKEWVEFESTDECQPLPGGIGNEGHYRTDHWPGYVGISLRFYDPQHQCWNIHWIDNRNAPGQLQPAVSGRFIHGVGLFEGDDEFGGKPIRVRFTWKVVDASHAQWEQAFSPDGGRTWETNWTMEFIRR
ncbi:hypothetical protein GETHLI_13190 [Geothrix limicola]|uniref:DUF1579 domain-containing protein n=1 Tax=Geothrix limicola TaxID=2927978 RepID=A0ABQ5QDA4_9BACT|nr:hypothetical protein [Geothrix limicola]GLH72817.1 hypothetical protein GETHLI_13190 [Geothrix limicola]